jgi:hypothetical protein
VTTTNAEKLALYKARAKVLDDRLFDKYGFVPCTLGISQSQMRSWCEYSGIKTTNEPYGMNMTVDDYMKVWEVIMSHVFESTVMNERGGKLHAYRRFCVNSVQQPYNRFLNANIDASGNSKLPGVILIATDLDFFGIIVDGAMGIPIKYTNHRDGQFKSIDPLTPDKRKLINKFLRDSVAYAYYN